MRQGRLTCGRPSTAANHRESRNAEEHDGNPERDESDQPADDGQRNRGENHDRVQVESHTGELT